VAEDLHSLIGRPLALDEELLSTRAQQLFAAIEQHPDFELHETRRATINDVPADVFVVTCDCDGVPQRNPVGIKYSEPLAIVVSRDPRAIPIVRAMRKNFPVTAHQNTVLDGEPASLCLYEELPPAILRTWTAPAFLRQITRWLGDTAHGRLHDPDQPVEHLFFDSPHEVILPAGYLDSPADDAPTLILTGFVERHRPADPARPGHTLLLEPVSPDRTIEKSIRFVGVTLPAITHGPVEREPSTLGALEDQLRARQTTVMKPLSEEIGRRVGEGVAPEDHFKSTLLLIRTPIRRTSDGPVERVQVRAFWIHADILTIGVEAGFIHRGKVYPHHYLPGNSEGSSGPSTAWRAREVMPVSVYQRPDAKTARQVSGTLDEGPVGVIAGVGSLGSTILGLWRRAGWGTWTAIDPDHVKPHNVIRHDTHAIGHTKADAVALMDASRWHDETPQIGTIVADASNLADAEVSAAMAQATLIVDATTRLEVPRRLANVSSLKRVVSCFLSPSGNDGVLLAEGIERRQRLDAIEAQYYRAVLTEPWGERHLARNGERFRTGTTCRDVSLVLPYARVMSHATALSEQIQRLSDKPQIRIWQRNPESGAVSVHDVSVHEPLVSSASALSIVWDDGLREKMRAMRQDSFPNETGGVLVGYHDFNESRIYVVDALPAPPDSEGTPMGFKRGVAGLADGLDAIKQRSGGQVVYLGEWHSHPPGNSAQESGADIWQLLYLGAHLQRDGLPGLMLIIGEQDEQWLIAK
jgi:hypothetical protein